MKRAINIFILTAISAIFFAGCSAESSSEFNNAKDISVISREEGSGTRGAFTELFEILQKSADGSKKDLTTKEAIISKQTDVMMTSIAGDKYAIGYISLGSLNDSVKALQIDGVSANAENVKNSTYKISRPFNIAIKKDISETAKDFIDFILSKQGQEVVSKTYISIDDNAPEYKNGNASGKIVVAGSSSVTPVMEKLKEAYIELNPNVVIEIQQSDSSAGMTGAIEGTCDIGMASRDLKDSEKSELKDMQIALDGIAVIVNNSNPISNLSKEAVKSIFIGEKTKWSEIDE